MALNIEKDHTVMCEWRVSVLCTCMCQLSPSLGKKVWFFVSVHWHHQKILLRDWLSRILVWFDWWMRIQRYSCVDPGNMATGDPKWPKSRNQNDSQKSDEKNHFLAHFSEITSFYNKNNESMSPGLFAWLLTALIQYRDTIVKLLRCSFQHYLWEVGGRLCFQGFALV